MGGLYRVVALSALSFAEVAPGPLEVESDHRVVVRVWMFCWQRPIYRVHMTL